SLQEIRLGSARCNVESRATLSQIKLAVWSPERAQCPLQYRYRRQAVGSPIAPLKACVHYDAKARSCAQCGVRLISVCAVLSPAELQDMAAMSQSDRFAARKSRDRKGRRRRMCSPSPKAWFGFTSCWSMADGSCWALLFP